MLLTDWLSSFTGLIGCKNGVMSRLSNFRGGRARNRRRPGLLTQRFLVAPHPESLEDRLLLAATNPVDLGALDGTNGFRLEGIDADDRSGNSVSGAGDINGDGYDDLIIGAERATGQASFSGESYVMFGKPDGFVSTISLSTLDGANGFRLDGFSRGDLSGGSVSSAGDVNGDGFDDLIVGAYRADPGGRYAAGESYVVFGKSSGFQSAINLVFLNGMTGFRLQGIDTRDLSGDSVSSAGDVNGDGFDDLIVGAYGADPGGRYAAGESYVVFGKSGGFSSVISLSTLNGITGFRLDGVDVSDHSGRSVSSAGDVNGDGFDDLLIGAFQADSSTGESYVVFGKSGGFSSAMDLDTLDGSTGFRLVGVDALDRSGFSVANAGDVNGDGFDDLIIGARRAEPGGLGFAGQSYVVFGMSGGFGATIQLSALDGTAGFLINGAAFGDGSGGSVSSAGDVDGDGFDDLIVGAFEADPRGDHAAGESFVIFGKESGFNSALELSTLDGSIGFQLNGGAKYDSSGYSVSSAGDVNGDGFDDLVIGAKYASPDGISKAGASYVVFGGNFRGGLETQVGDSGANTLMANLGLFATDILVGGRGNDTLISDGGADVLRGGEGDDALVILDNDFSRSRRIVGGSGTDTLQLDGTGLTLDLTAIPDNRIVDVEVIDLNGGGNALTLDFQEVVNISSTSNTLLIRRNLNDTVDIGSGWTEQPVEFVQRQRRQRFDVFTQGAATLKVQGAIPHVSLSTTVAKGDVFPSTIVTITVTSNLPVIGEQSVDAILSTGRHDYALGTIVSLVTLTIPDGETSVTETLTLTDNGASPLPGTVFIRLTNPSGGLAFPSSNGERISLITKATPVVPRFLDGADGILIANADRGVGIGDFNGDGLDDFACSDRNANEFAGVVHVVFGQVEGLGTSVDIDSLDGSNGFTFEGVGNERVGTGVFGSHDVNGDGLSDLLITGGDTSYFIFGRRTGITASLAPSDLQGEAGYQFETPSTSGNGRPAFAGDLNGDGLEDFVFRERAGTIEGNTSVVVFGRPDGVVPSFESLSLDGSDGFRLTGGLHLGQPNSVGDINGDGFDDLLLESSLEIDEYSFSTRLNHIAKAAVVFGTSGGFAPEIDLLNLDGTNGFRIGGFGSRFRAQLSAAGDINGDGFDDLLIGGNFKDDQVGRYFLYGGSVHVVFGKSEGFTPILNLNTLDGTDGFEITDGRSGYFGASVSGAGDINGDGFDDILIGAAGENGDDDGLGYRHGTGRAVVVFGRSDPFPLRFFPFVRARFSSFVDGTDGIIVLGPEIGAETGETVSIAGDVNGDGFDDLLISSPFRSDEPDESYLIFGRDFTAGAESQIGDDSADTLTANLGAGAIDILIGGRGADTLVSDGGSDVLIGGEGGDTLAIVDTDFSSTRRLQGGNGSDTVRLDGAGLHFDLTAIANNRITDIEEIDIRGDGENTLTLDFQEVVNISGSSNTLLVRRDVGDTVNIGTGWTPAPLQTIDSLTYDVFLQGAAVLAIHMTKTTQSVSLPSGGGTYTIALNGQTLELQQTQPTASLINSLPLHIIDDLIINGSTSADHVALGDLTGFTGTIFFNAGSGDDLFDASTAAQTTAVQGGSGNDTFLGGSGNDRFVGGSGADSASGGAGDDTLLGIGGNDSLAGNGGNDFVNGNAGADLLTGNGGDDTVLGGGGPDVLDGGSGNDFVNGQGGQGDIVAGGGGGQDTLLGGRNDVILPGSAGTVPTTPSTPGLTGSTLNVALPATGGPFTILVNATQLQVNSAGGTIVDVPLAEVSDISITGSSSDDAVILDATLSALPGRVSFIAGAGDDSLDSSAGSINTSFSGGAGNDSLTGGGGIDIFDGGDGDDSATGGAGNDTLTGGGGDDSFAGDADNDFLNGNNGSDSLFGGTGDDTLLGGRNTDLLDGGDGSDLVNGQGGTGDIVAGGGGGTDSLRGDLSDTLLDGPSGSAPGSTNSGGSAVSDGVLTVSLPAGGGTYDVRVFALQLQVIASGDSTPLVDETFPGISDIIINGSGGDDVVVLDASLAAQAVPVTFNGFGGNDSLDSSLVPANIVFNGGAGDDTLIGGSGNDTANGGIGNDSISTGAGTDRVNAGAGNDWVDAGAGADSVFGGDGDDIVFGGTGNDLLNGNAGSDTMNGGDDDDTLLGGGAADSLNGGLGNDLVRGQGGDPDTAIGGGGIDVVLP